MTRIIASGLIAFFLIGNANAQQAQPTVKAEAAPVKTETLSPGDYMADPEAAIERHRRAFFERINERKSETPVSEVK